MTQIMNPDLLNEEERRELDEFKEPLDLLRRDQFVDQIMNILIAVNKAKSSYTFAVSGEWGIGKTFVLNKLINQLWDYQTDSFVVFRYNCWEFDYYEEPLIAIIAAMLDSIDKEAHLLPVKFRRRAKTALKAAEPHLKAIAKTFVQNKIGVDITELIQLYDDVKKANKETKEENRQDHSWDLYFSFKEAIQKARKKLKKLAEHRTIVVVVDELDRCLPDYAIKVLERLHHLFYGMENVAVIIAVDKGQLDRTVNQIFGDLTDTPAYLRKFLDFELQLNAGDMCMDVDLQSGPSIYSELTELYDLSNQAFLIDPRNEISKLMRDVPIRTQEKILARMKLAHNVFFPGQQKDPSVMYAVLLWSVLNTHYKLDMDHNPFSLKLPKSNPGPVSVDLVAQSIKRSNFPFPSMCPSLQTSSNSESADDGTHIGHYTSGTIHITGNMKFEDLGFGWLVLHYLLEYYQKKNIFTKDPFRISFGDCMADVISKDTILRFLSNISSI